MTLAYSERPYLPLTLNKVFGKVIEVTVRREERKTMKGNYILDSSNGAGK